MEVRVRVSSFGCMFLLLKRNEEEWGSSVKYASSVWICQKMLMDIFFGNFLFFCMFSLSTKNLLNTSVGVSRYKELFLAIFVSSYFKIFLIAMMVWEFPASVIFIIDLFVLSSNIVALKVITESTMSRCVGACLSAHAVKFFASQIMLKVQGS